MSSPWDALARNVGGGPGAADLESMLTGTSSLSRAFQFAADGVPGGLGQLVPDAVSEPVPKPSPPSGGSVVSVLFVVRGAGGDVCGGKIGDDDAKFCTFPCIDGQQSCGRVAKHERTKANLKFPAYYIRTPARKGGGAFCHPVLVAPPEGFSHLAISVVGEPTSVRTVAEWGEVFAVLSGFEAFSPTEQRRVLDRINTKVYVGPTPMKPRKLIGLDDSSEELMEASDTWMVKTPGVYSAWMIDEGEDESPMEDFIHIKGHWNEVIHALTVQRRNLELSEANTHDVLEAIDTKVMKIQSALGSPSDLIPAPDIWSSIVANTVFLRHLSLTQDTLQKEVGGMDGRIEEFVVKSGTAVDKKVNVLTDQMTSVNLGMHGLTNELHQKVFPVVHDVCQRVAIMEGSSGGTSRGLEVRVDLMHRTLDRLDHDLTEIKAQPRTTLPGLSFSVGGSNQSELESKLAWLTLEFGKLKDKVEILEEENIKLKKDISVESIHFGGQVFPNKESYLVFIQTHSKRGYFGACYDFISFMECQIDQNRTSDEAIKSLKILGGVGYDGLSSGRIDTSFSSLIPRIFGKEQDPKDPSKKMEKLTTMDIWDHPTSQSGVKADIQSFIVTYAETARGQIESVYPIHSQAYRFFNVMIDHIVSFWNRLETWITRFERELSAQCGGDDPTIHKAYIWKLICWMLHCMFKEFQKRRQPGTMNAMSTQESTVEEKQVKAASILQGTIQAHLFMAELMKDEFVRHPIFASTMVEFLLKTKASHVSMLDLIKKQKALEVKLTGIQSNVDKIAAKKVGGVGGNGGGGGGNGAAR